MEFFLDYSWKDDYCGDQTGIARVEQCEFYRQIANSKWKYGSVSTVVTQRVPKFLRWCYWLVEKFDKHLMVLDCDSTDEMLGVVAMLQYDKIGYAIIQSSPSRYWLITDYINDFTHVILRMQAYPGADKRHIELACRRSLLTVRAISLPNKVPIFPDSHTLTKPLAVKFFDALRVHYEHPAIARKLQALLIADNITDKTMIEMAANPSFVL